MPPCIIRPATPADLDAINSIYNHYVGHKLGRWLDVVHMQLIL
jgi:L-amino acid N-acyltransferase YncA